MKRILILTTSLFAFYQTSAIADAPYPQYAALVEKHAALQRLDKNIVWAVMGRESSGNRYALSNKNARGLLQVIPPTAARMGVNPKNLYDPEQNIMQVHVTCVFYVTTFLTNPAHMVAILIWYWLGITPVRELSGNMVAFRLIGKRSTTSAT